MDEQFVKELRQDWIQKANMDRGAAKKHKIHDDKETNKKKKKNSGSDETHKPGIKAKEDGPSKKSQEKSKNNNSEKTEARIQEDVLFGDISDSINLSSSSSSGSGSE